MLGPVQLQTLELLHLSLVDLGQGRPTHDRCNKHTTHI